MSGFAILCIAEVDMKSVTTSIRLPEDLRKDLEKYSRALHRGKNWIILQALREYLSQTQNSSLQIEAKKQSELVTAIDEDDRAWQKNADTKGWR